MGRKAGTAKQHKDDQDNERQAARDRSSSVVDLTLKLDSEQQMATVRELTTSFNALRAEGTAINDRRKAVLERIDALGFDRHEFRGLVKLLNIDDELRSKKARTRRIFLRAHGLPEQGELFETPQAPADNAAAAQGIDPAILDAVANGFISEDELAANREFEAMLNAAGDTDDDLYERAGVMTVEAGEDD